MPKFTAIRGKYKPVNLIKYAGNAKKITYRSMWERRFMLYCDRSNRVKKWSSEEVAIPYLSPLDNKWHTYYPDFYIEFVDAKRVTRSRVIEIKPRYQCSFKVNKAKWETAKKYCSENNLEFQVLTEEELF